jgi:hypothetical protein
MAESLDFFSYCWASLSSRREPDGLDAGLWGWRLAIAIFATQVLGDLVNALTGDFVQGAVGFIIAGALLIYLLHQDVRTAFRSGNAPRTC